MKEKDSLPSSNILRSEARSDRDLLIAIDTRQKAMQESMLTLVTHVEFAPVKYIAYSLVGMVLSGVLAALIALVLKKP